MPALVALLRVLFFQPADRAPVYDVGVLPALVLLVLVHFGLRDVVAHVYAPEDRRVVNYSRILVACASRCLCWRTYMRF
jgi:hypothetical protein